MSPQLVNIADLERLWPDWREKMASLIQMPYHYNSLYDALLREGPWPHLVYYRAGKVHYVPPDRFRLDTEAPSPSDCTWIVPGTTGER